MISQTNISQMEEDDLVEGFFLIKEVAFKAGKTNQKYGDFTIGDKSGEINAKLWQLPRNAESEFRTNAIIKIRGRVIRWQNVLQIRIEMIRLAVEKDCVKTEDFVQSAPFSSEEMITTLKAYIEKIESKEIKAIVSQMIADKYNKLMHYPAAKANHHSVRGGLLYHITTMLKAGEKLCEVYTFLKRDLIFGGVIVHDICKIEEMKANELGIVSDYTVEGMLLGHITQGVNYIGEIAKRTGASKETTLMLQHMVLTHHYEPEYGSPKRPMFPEAEMLHFLDIMDTRMYDMVKVLETVQEGGFSERQWLLHNRKIYKVKAEEES